MLLLQKQGDPSIPCFPNVWHWRTPFRTHNCTNWTQLLKLALQGLMSMLPKDWNTLMISFFWNLKMVIIFNFLFLIWIGISVDRIGGVWGRGEKCKRDCILQNRQYLDLHRIPGTFQDCKSECLWYWTGFQGTFKHVQLSVCKIGPVSSLFFHV